MDMIKYVEEKRRLIENLRNKLPRSSIERAESDHHSKRRPRPCGFTIHTGIGCKYSCTYCYIYDMGFPHKVTPYPLTGEELVLALLLNPYFIPGRDGSLVAFGSVTEPFLPETFPKTIEYLEHVGALGNPIQLSTKSSLSSKEAAEVGRVVRGHNILMTVITLKKYRELEPLAPPPSERFRTCTLLTKYGAAITLFVRPIIPGVTDVEVRNILEEALSHGIRTVVFGGLRITKRILINLEKLGINLRLSLIHI